MNLANGEQHGTSYHPWPVNVGTSPIIAVGLQLSQIPLHGFGKTVRKRVAVKNHVGLKLGVTMARR